MRDVVVLGLVLLFLTTSTEAIAQQAADDAWEGSAEIEAVHDTRGINSQIIRRRGGADRGGDGTARPVSSGPVCVAEPLRSDFEDHRRFAYIQLNPDHVFYWRVCGDERSLEWYRRVDRAPADQSDDVRTLIDEVLSRLEPRAPRLVTSPPAGSEVLTGMPMYLAVDAGSFSVGTDTISSGPVSVTARLEPFETRFDPGDGSEPVVCEGAGTVWSSGDRPQPGDCTHTFTDVPSGEHGDVEAGTFSVSARVRYRASYTVSGAALSGTFDLGELDGPPASFAVPVIERRAVRTAP